MAAKKKATKKVAPVQHRSRKGFSKLDEITVRGIDDTAKKVYSRINNLAKPELKFPVRSLANVRYDQRRGYFELGRIRKERTLTVNTV